MWKKNSVHVCLSEDLTKTDTAALLYFDSCDDRDMEISGLQEKRQVKSFHSSFLPCPLQKQVSPTGVAPGREPLLVLHVTIFFHPSNPEPRTDAVMAMDMEALPQLTAKPLPAGSVCSFQEEWIFPSPFIVSHGPRDHPVSLLLPYLAHWSRSFSLLFCRNRKSKQA